MEVAATDKIDSKTSRLRNSSFECDSFDIDSILGICSIGNSSLRVDNAGLPRPSHLVKRDAQVHAPIEVAIADNSQRDSCLKPNVLSLELDAELKRQRLLRLLDHQQAWYDVGQQAISAAEQFLSLCEHHQQQWLQSNQQPPTLSLTILT
ncbi:MAG TPA: hypothetical protein VM260_04360 [Pirellula sp.]|nr:hypothetical protein [Pirellula sp.]